MSISAPRLRLSRHGTYYFRYLVPPQFIEQVGKKELRRSLRTKNSQIAKIVALYLNALIEKALKDLTPLVLTLLSSTESPRVSWRPVGLS